MYRRRVGEREALAAAQSRTAMKNLTRAELARLLERLRRMKDRAREKSPRWYRLDSKIEDVSNRLYTGYNLSSIGDDYDGR